MPCNGPSEAGLLEAGVQPIGVLQGPRVDGDDGVEHRTALVVRVNSIQGTAA